MLRARVPRVAKLSNNYTLTVDAAAYTVSGQNVNLVKSSVLVVDPASYSITTQNVNLIKSSVLTVDPASYSVTGQNVNLIYTPVGKYTLAVDPASVGVTFQNVQLLKSSVLAVDPASFSVTGKNVTLTYTPGGATPAQIWAYELLPGVSAGDMLIALYQNACPTAAQNAAAVLAAMNAAPPGVDVRKVNGYTVDGSGTQADPWGPV